MTRVEAVIQAEGHERLEAELVDQGAQILSTHPVARRSPRVVRLRLLIRDERRVHRAVEAIARAESFNAPTWARSGSIIVTPLPGPDVEPSRWHVAVNPPR
jgi:hypothetical protein